MEKKKLLVLLVLSAFLINVFSAGLASAGQKDGNATITIDPNGQVTISLQFKDLESAIWALKDIAKMQSQDVIKGYADGTFRPNKPIKRAEAVAMAIRLMGLEKEATVKDSIYGNVYSNVYLPFADSNLIESWAKGYIGLALEKRIIDSTPDNFQPHKPASRLWVAVLLTKALGLQAEAEAKKNVQLTFKDAGAIPADLAGYVAVAVEKGLVKGFPDNTFQPNKPVTRAEMAALLGRTDDQLVLVNDKKKKAKGVVTAVDPVASTISITEEAVASSVYSAVYGLSETFPVDPEARIFIGDQRADLTDIKVGSKVQLRLKDGVVVFIEVKVREVEGIVVAKSVYSLTVDSEEDEDDDDFYSGEIKVTPDTKIKIEGKRKAAFADILVGDKIEAKVVNGEAMVIKVEDRNEEDEDEDEDKDKYKEKRKEKVRDEKKEKLKDKGKNNKKEHNKDDNEETNDED